MEAEEVLKATETLTKKWSYSDRIFLSKNKDVLFKHVSIQ